jgi:hypothetical protein
LNASGNDPEFVTASEVADYVFCKHSWHLRRQGVSVSDDTRVLMNAGVQWQDGKDSLIPAAIEHQARANRASLLAWVAAIVLMAGIALWELYSLLHR